MQVLPKFSRHAPMFSITKNIGPVWNKKRFFSPSSEYNVKVSLIDRQSFCATIAVAATLSETQSPTMSPQNIFCLVVTGWKRRRVSLWKETRTSHFLNPSGYFHRALRRLLRVRCVGERERGRQPEGPGVRRAGHRSQRGGQLLPQWVHISLHERGKLRFWMVPVFMNKLQQKFCVDSPSSHGHAVHGLVFLPQVCMKLGIQWSRPIALVEWKLLCM